MPQVTRYEQVMATPKKQTMQGSTVGFTVGDAVGDKLPTIHGSDKETAYAWQHCRVTVGDAVGDTLPTTHGSVEETAYAWQHCRVHSRRCRR